ncbi:DeoR/GlpR family DNA-binding transcription regulator [Deinococcus peraridilitoris]|uniref:Transcriptional regulator of sugar metabolism n=1 Tax=Deinococcus peraridilitoris (strain DSM 19664 / LMG 22246 / CIP 109416 / KR-200) TaxID=937777 RepID=K9ZWD6_DEIPD|nr:DeoR/GlpR family DNA-binding transcription regulator [Deinococcus peraridilitoris]AFZ65958.1 transcriptional regulator of sugar metabolism [Deinococcus peraridilitoris DSM 19664]
MQARLRVILSELDKRERVTVDQLSTLLGVSKVTIRSDLEILHRQGLIHRTRGGALRPIADHAELPLEETRKQRSLEKRRIGAAAAALIEEGDTVFLDVGSTCTEIARSLSPLLRNVTIVTSGLNIAFELEKQSNVTVVVTGGTLRRLQHSLVNPFGLQLITSLHADKLFLGCNGVSVQAGITSRNLEEAEIKRCMVGNARQTIVVADHSKLGEISTAAVAPLSAVSQLITDRGAASAPLEELRACGLNLVTV